MKSKIFIFTTLILVVFLFAITSCDNFLNAQNKTTININLDLSKILKTSRNETTTSITDYILKVFAYNAATYKPEDEIQNLPLLTQTENKVDINGNVKASLDVEIGLNVIFVAKLYQGKSEKPLYAGKSEVIKIKATNNKVHLVLTRENADLDIDILVHDHTFAEEWASDATHHWHEATCEHTTEVREKGEHTYINGICVCGMREMVLIPVGTFQMGTENGYYENDKPVHQVTITKSFYMGKYEVTQAEYEKYCSYTGSFSPSSSDGAGDGDNYPAYYVSWNDVLVYCNKRSIAEGLTPCYSISGNTDPSEWGTVPTSNNNTWDAVVCNWNANGYRLPTEAEWEYAARAGDNIVDRLTYSGTSNLNELGDYAWYMDNSYSTTYEVGKKLPNAFGLYDMSGNVNEWCWNWYTDSYDTGKEGGSNPTGASSGSLRVARGGSSFSPSYFCAVSNRTNNRPNNSALGIGFRVVRTATEVIENLAHTHKFATDWTKNETHHWHAATCGHDVTDSKAAHTFGNWTTTKEATEEEEGSKEQTCIVCGYTATEVIEKLAHTHKFAESWSKDETHHWYAATCEHTTEESGKVAHSFNWQVTKEASCTEEGERKGTCTTCGYEKTEITDKEHTFGIWEVETAPTSTTEGTSKRICSTCNFEERKSIIAIPENFALIPAGTFQMGSNAGNDSDKPVHQVTITKPFYMGKYEVTQAEYEKYCSYGSSSPSSDCGEGDNYPAYWVSWYEALVYCNKRSIDEGLTPCYSISESTAPEDWGTVPTSNDDRWNTVVCNWDANGYRLPIEAEWEYTARAGDNTVESLTYSGTSDVNELGDYAWYSSSSGTHEVGRKLPNAFGLYDMSGNVWEWCWNWKTSSYDTETEGDSDPTGVSSGVSRVNRGGSWHNTSGNSAVSFRGGGYPYNHIYNIGFRVVRPATTE